MLMIAISGMSPVTAQAEMSLQCNDLDVFMGNLAREELEREHLPGMVISIVQGNERVFSSSYGDARLGDVRAEADSTLYQIGSVSKLFTWTAVMQLVEQGELDLDADVQTYLGERLVLPVREDGPVTLAHLMHHTAGFEDRIIGIYTHDPFEIGTLHDFLSAHIPVRVRRAGEVTSYSNYGTVLAAYIVEIVSGQPFTAYVHDHILQPLDMETTYFQYEVPESKAHQLATGYEYKNDALQPAPTAYTRQTGAGGMVSTAGDMARFMSAYLLDERGNGSEILQPGTISLMQSQRFANDERLSGVAHGFWEETMHGYRVLYHSGDSLHFSAMLALIPEANTGLFLVHNRVTSAPRERILEAFINQCLPPQAEQGFADPTDTATQAELNGFYRGIRLPYNSPARISGFAQAIHVKMGKDAALTFGGVPYREIDTLLFEQVEGGEHLAFRQEKDGSISYLFLDSNPFMAYEKVYWYETPLVDAAALALPTGFFILSAVLGLLGIIRHWGSRKADGSNAIAWTAGLLGLLALLTITGAGAAMLNSNAIVFGPPPALQAAMIFANAFAVVGLILLGATIYTWVRGILDRSQRIHLTLLALLSVLFTLALRYWNLVPW